MVKKQEVSMYEVIVKAASKDSVKSALKGFDLSIPDDNGKLFLDYVVEYEKGELLSFCYDKGLFSVKNGIISVNDTSYNKYEDLLILLLNTMHESLHEIDLDAFDTVKLKNALEKFLLNKKNLKSSNSFFDNYTRIQFLALYSITKNKIDYVAVERALKTPGFSNKLFDKKYIDLLLSTKKGKDFLFELLHFSKDNYYFDCIKKNIGESRYVEFSKWYSKMERLDYLSDVDKLSEISVPDEFEKGDLEVIDAYLEKCNITSANQIVSCCKDKNDWYYQKSTSGVWNYYKNEDLIIYLTKKGITVPTVFTPDPEGGGDSTIDLKYLAIVLKHSLK